MNSPLMDLYRFIQAHLIPVSEEGLMILLLAILFPELRERDCAYLPPDHSTWAYTTRERDEGDLFVSPNMLLIVPSVRSSLLHLLRPRPFDMGLFDNDALNPITKWNINSPGNFPKERFPISSQPPFTLVKKTTFLSPETREAFRELLEEIDPMAEDDPNRSQAEEQHQE